MSDRDTDRDWMLIAERDPYWGVVSVPDYLGGEDLAPEARERFFATGEESVRMVFDYIRTHLHKDFAPRTALDYGCGVGRLLLPMAERVTHVTGVDVAPRMLDICRANADARGLFNLDLLLARDGLPDIGGPFDFVNCYLVLQHIPTQRGYPLLARLIDLIAVGGSASIQISYGRARRFLEHEAPRAQYFRREGVVIHDLVPQPSPLPPGSVTMYDYDLNQVFPLIQRVSGGHMLVLPIDGEEHLSLHILFYKARA
jgi:SAM-dependent methyltransferase